MPRAPRAQYRGALYHVFVRGNRRQKVFLDDDDYRDYVALLSKLARELDAEVLAYCLMPNHPHLCVRTQGAPLSSLMQRLNTTHAVRFNRKYKVQGHLNEGRYRALVVDADVYLLRLVRYIHRNPVRAGLVARAGDWAHSSHREYLARDSWVARHHVLRHFESPETFEEFVAQETTEEDAAVFRAADRGFRFAGSLAGIEAALSSVRSEAKKDLSE